MKTRNVEFIFYEIEDVYNAITICNKNDFEYAYIRHDKDLFDNLEDFKKTHYHFQVYNEYQKELTTWGRLFDVNMARVQKISNKKSAIRYLIHADNNDKFQYDIVDIFSNFEIIKYFDKLVSDENCEIDLIFTYIEFHKRRITTKEIIDYVLDNNIWGTFRRNYSIIKDLLSEHNLLFTTSKLK